MGLIQWDLVWICWKGARGTSIFPKKLAFFVWELWWGKIMTLDQIKKIGFSLANRCYLCNESEESIEHLLIHCPKVWNIWASLLAAFVNLSWVVPWSIRDPFCCCNRILMRKDDKKICKTALCCLLWVVLKEK